MEAPIDFRNRLSRLFDDRIRIRWSNKRQEWHLEYKIARGKATVPFYVDSYDDPAIRARDGYAHLMAVRSGDRMPCPRCGCTVKVPMFEIKMAHCDYCKMGGKNYRFPACYFSLEGDLLIQHLAKMDPLRTWRDGIHLQTDKQNDELMKSRQRDFNNKMEAITKENFTNLFSIPSVGFTGREKMWDGPAKKVA